MKKIFLSIVLLIASLSWGGYSSFAAPSCPDTSYIMVNVTLGHSDCEALASCNFSVQLWLMSSPPRLLVETPYVTSQNTYVLCVQGPVYFNICPKLVVVGFCSSYTLTQTPNCTSWGSFPQWGQTVYTSIDPYCWVH
jgi:hypothetical protein